jgi:hypothetical protein
MRPVPAGEIRDGLPHRMDCRIKSGNDEVVMARSQSDEAIRASEAVLDCFASLAMTRLWRNDAAVNLRRSLPPTTAPARRPH